MIHALLIVFGLLNFSGLAFGSEQPVQEINVYVGFPVPTAHCLSYSNAKNRQACQFFGIDSDVNEPFISINKPIIKFHEIYQSEICTEISTRFAEIKAIPYRCLLDINNKFKKGDEEIVFPVKLQDKYKIKMLMLNDLLSGYENPIWLLDNFKKEPNFALNDKKELIAAGLITADDKHGVNAMECIKASQPFSYFSYLKKPFFCVVGLAACFVIYKKFYCQ